MMCLSRSNSARSVSAVRARVGRIPSTSPMISMPRLWKVRTVISEATLASSRLRTRSSISFRASRAKASNRSSDGLRNPLRTSHPALATMTEVLPLPAAAMTRLRSSSITTALRCSPVRGLASIWSNRVRDRVSSVVTNASLALDRTSSGVSRNAWMSLSVRTSGASRRESGQRPARFPSTACAFRACLPKVAAPTYLGGFSSFLSCSCSNRSESICNASARRHHSVLAVSTACTRVRPLARGSPDTATTPAAWRIRRRVQRHPTSASTAWKSPKGISRVREPRVSRMRSAFTDAAFASPGRSTANSIDATSPVRLALTLVSGSGISWDNPAAFPVSKA